MGRRRRANGYAHPIWATYKQWGEMGAQVRGGEKASPVVFYKEYDTEPDPDREDDDGKRRVAKASHVFNCAQVDGFSPPAEPVRLGPIERIEAVDRFLAHLGAKVVHGGESAFYRRSTDTIHMPDEALFVDTKTMTRTEGYYAVSAHEHVHWCGAEHRLNREFGKRFGDHQYTAEELVAEIGCRLPRRGIAVHAGHAARPCAVPRALAEAAERRPEGDLHGRRQGKPGCQLPQEPATARARAARATLP